MPRVSSNFQIIAASLRRAENLGEAGPRRNPPAQRPAWISNPGGYRLTERQGKDHQGARMTVEDPQELLIAELATLRAEHRDLDGAISALEATVAPDRIALQRLKKRKLLLRDRIAHIEDQLYPDIIA